MPEPVLRFDPPGDTLTYEPCPRWIRGRTNSETIVDSRNAFLVWEPGAPVPFYVVPVADVRPGTLSPAAKPPKKGGSVFHDVTVAGATMPNAAWTYPGAIFTDTVCFAWTQWHGTGLDEWYEEAEQVFVHPRDPFSRVDALPSERHVVVTAGDRVLADSRRPVLVFETGLPTRYYLPPEDVDLTLLTATETRTRCPYKGVATYLAEAGLEVAWRYPESLIPAIAGLIAFYDDRTTITVS